MTRRMTVTLRPEPFYLAYKAVPRWLSGGSGKDANSDAVLINHAREAVKS